MFLVFDDLRHLLLIDFIFSHLFKYHFRAANNFAARQLYEWGVKEVLVTLGGMGSLIFDGKDFYRIPAYKPREVVDATGCGDTYTIGYLYQRVSGAGIEEAGRFAAAMSTLKIEKSGPFNGSKEDVIQCMTTAEQMF